MGRPSGSKNKPTELESSIKDSIGEKSTETKTPVDFEKDLSKATIKRLEDINGIGPKVAEKLRDLGYTVLGLATGRADAISSEMGPSVSYSKAKGWVMQAQQAILGDMTMKSSVDYDKEKKAKQLFFHTGSNAFNMMVAGDSEHSKEHGGGIPTMSITGLTGRLSSGKSQICFDAIVDCIGRHKKKAVFIETEPDTFHLDRLKEINKYRKLDCDWSNLIVCGADKIPTVKAQFLFYKKIQKELEKGEDIKLIVIDSFNAKLRAGWSRSEMLPIRSREVAEHFNLMEYLAAKYNLAWLITCQAIAPPRPNQGLAAKVKFVDNYYPVGGDTLLHCYDEETEILTLDGWKYFKDLNDEDKVACLEEGCLVYRKPQERQVYKYEGEMILFSGKSGDLLVTPNHKMWVRHDKNNKWRFKEAKEFLNLTIHGLHHYETLRKCEWYGMDKESFTFEGHTRLWKAGKNHTTPNKKIYPNVTLKTESYMKLLGWYLSEGNTDEYKGEFRGITITQKKRVIELEKDLDDIGLKYKKYDDCHYKIYSPQLAKAFSILGKSYEKYIPKDVKGLHSDYLKLLLSRLLLGDGKGNIYTTSSKELADDVQEIMIKCGYGVTISKQKQSVGFIKGRKINSNRTMYLVIPSTHATPRICKKPQEVDYDGYVYDVTVPEHIILVRRNGRAVWSSNSVQNWVALMQRKSELYVAALFDSSHVKKSTCEFMLTGRGLSDGIK